MNAKKCDRCGVFYMENEKNALQQSLDEVARAMDRMAHGECVDLFERMKGRTDLCLECKISLRKWCYKEAEQ